MKMKSFFTSDYINLWSNVSMAIIFSCYTTCTTSSWALPPSWWMSASRTSTWPSPFPVFSSRSCRSRDSRPSKSYPPLGIISTWWDLTQFFTRNYLQKKKAQFIFSEHCCLQHLKTCYVLIRKSEKTRRNCSKLFKCNIISNQTIYCVKEFGNCEYYYCN